MKVNSKYSHHGRYTAIRTTYSQVNDKFCPICGSGRIRASKLQHGRIVCYDCYEVFDINFKEV